MSFLFWTVTFLVLHYLIVVPWMTVNRGKGSRINYTEYFNIMTPKQKMLYTSNIHHVLFGLVAFSGAVFGFLYADGVPDTTWFHCNFYKINMFDVQKYMNMVAVGYFIFDLLFCLYTGATQGQDIDIYMLQIARAAVTVIGTYLGGFFGSISQLTWFTEGSTPFVNFCKVLVLQHQKETLFYTLSNLLTLIVYFICNVFLYQYMIFWKMQDMCLYRFDSFWILYEEKQHKICYLFIAVYFVMYCLQNFLFSKMLWDFFRDIGIDKAIEKTERIKVRK